MSGKYISSIFLTAVFLLMITTVSAAAGGEPELTGMSDDQDMHITVVYDVNNAGYPDPAPAPVTVTASLTQKAPVIGLTGYHFTGWNTDDSAGGGSHFDPDAELNISILSGLADDKGEVRLFAEWEMIEYTVTYNINNKNYTGEEPPDSEVNIDRDARVPTLSNCEGYGLIGWTEAEDGNGTLFKPNDLINVYNLDGYDTEIVLYGQWVRLHTVTFDAAGGSPAPSPAIVTVPDGQTVSEPTPAPEKNGYDFSGWRAENDDGSYNFTLAVKSDLNLTAFWTEKIATLKYVSSNRTMGDVSLPEETVGAVNGNAADVTATANRGYHFVNWTLDGNEVSTGESFKAPKNNDSIYVNATYTANFEEDTVVLSYTSSNTTMGTVSPSNETVAVISDTASGASASALTGYHFINWTLSGTEVSTDADFTPQKTDGAYAAGTYIANFGETVIRVSYDANNADYNGSVPDGVLVTVTNPSSVDPALILDGQTSGGWNTAADGSGMSFSAGDNLTYAVLSPYIDEETGDVTLYALWSENEYGVEWNWQKNSKTNYKATATFTDENGEIVAENVKATVTSTTENDIVTYTATVNFEGTDYTDEKSFYTGGFGTPQPVIKVRAGVDLVKAMIDYLVNGTPLPEDYMFDLNEDDTIDGRDLIKLEQIVSENGFVYKIVQ